MKFTAIVTLAFSLAALDGVFAAPAPQDLSVASSSEMSVAMSGMMAKKMAGREGQRGKGIFNKGKYKGKKDKAVAPCKNGISAGEYRCSNVDMTGFLSHEDMGSETVCSSRRKYCALILISNSAKETMSGDGPTRAGNSVLLARLTVRSSTSYFHNMH